MPSNKGFVELRKHKRFNVREGVYVEFYRPPLLNLGSPRLLKRAQVTDISEGGLGFIYTDRQMWSPDFNELTISDNINEIRIARIPFKILRDFPISRQPKSFYLRKCAVAFGVLTADQRSGLHSLIQAHSKSDDARARRTGEDRRKAGDPQDGDAGKRKYETKTGAGISTINNKENLEILIVDDNEIDLELLEAILQRIGFRKIVKSSNARDAVRLIKENPPDLFFIDILMPGMTGGELRGLLKESAATKDTPVIFISGIISKEEERDMRGRLRSGDIIVAKPFSTDRISEAIAESFEKNIGQGG